MGRTIIDSSELYFETSGVSQRYYKTGTLYTLPSTQTFGLIGLYCCNDRAGVYAAVKTFIYAQNETLLAQSDWQNVTNINYHWEMFPLTTNVTLNPAIDGDKFLLGFMVFPLFYGNGSGALRVHDSFAGVSWTNRDGYDIGLSDPFNASGADGMYVTPAKTLGDYTWDIFACQLDPFAPNATFKITTLPSIKNIPITFNASDSIPGWNGVTLTNITTYAWNWGDGTSDSISASGINHTYTSAGQYTVALTITDSESQVSSVSQEVIIYEGTGSWTSNLNFESDAQVNPIFRNVLETQTYTQPFPFQSENTWYSATAVYTHGYNIITANRPGSIGTHCLNMSLDSPVGESDRRIHLRHLLRPTIDSDVDMTLWIYLPATFQADAWTEFIPFISERNWTYTGVENFGFGITMAVDPSYKDGSNFKAEMYVNRYSIWGAADVGTQILASTPLTLGGWTKIRGHVYRPIESHGNPASSKAGGYFEIWINDIKQTFTYLNGTAMRTTWTLDDMGSLGTYHRQDPNTLRIYCGTCGQDPYQVATLRCTTIPGNQTRGWVEGGGLDLYTETNGTPKYVYYDDVNITTWTTTWNGISITSTPEINVDFTINNTQYTTPYSIAIDYGEIYFLRATNLTATMDGTTYYFAYWEKVSGSYQSFSPFGENVTLSVLDNCTIQMVFSESAPGSGNYSGSNPNPYPFGLGISAQIAFLMQYLWNRDFVGFIIACYTTTMGEWFFLMLGTIVGVALYLKIKNLAVLGVAWILTGAIFIPVITTAWPIISICFILGMAAMLYKLFHHTT